jgi:Protein of unknwon function (DUF3008)
MPAKSKKQQMAAGAALAAKRGKRSKSSLKGASRQMAKSMSKSELRRMAKTKRKGNPHANARKGRTRISATRQLHEPKSHTQAEESADEKKNMGRDEAFHSPVLSPCIAAVPCVKGAKLTLLVPVKGWSST